MLLRRRLVSAAIVFIFCCATLQFVRYYTVSTPLYIDLPAYLAGQERLPFQERVLPILLMKPLAALLTLGHAVLHSEGAYTPERAPLYIINLIAMVAASLFTQKLYNLASTPARQLNFLVYPVFLFAMMWTYSIHTEANFSYPYDLLSVAFFSAGLYFIYARQYLPLLLVILLGTLNRETTLFLIGIYILDACSRSGDAPPQHSVLRLNFGLVPWARAVLLLTLWIVVKLSLARLFRANSQAENYVRIGENFGMLKPRLWPALLNICGYVLPFVLLFIRELKPARLRNYFWILPLWLAVAFYTGILVETRIYGELCPLVAVAAVLLMEQYTESSGSVGDKLQAQTSSHGRVQADEGVGYR